ncbi:MAG: hypothetical protein M3364_04895, partial [Actinomycetota bacterium]|nr:hypothetical protein [Actinomycetota bacterium]
MSAFNSVSDALELYIKPFDDEPEAWSDVLSRAGVVDRQRTRPPIFRRLRVAAIAVAIAALVALAVSPVGGAIVRGVGDFSAWLSGNPGEPASESEQRAFEAANERSWGGFPDGTELRRVITTEAAGGTFELFGFRTGGSLCLRLTVEGYPNERPTTVCAPLAELRRAEAPALAVRLDTSFGRRDVPPTEGYAPARASASFGIVADGVKGVELQTTAGPADATVENNAFLAITADPPLGLRSQELTAIGEQGERVAVALAEAPFGDYGPQAKREVAPGPKEVERRVEGGRIGWLATRDERGESLEEAGVDDRLVALGGRGKVRFARVIEPDPVGIRRVVVALVYVAPNQDPAWPGTQGEQLCYSLVYRGGGGGGCSPVGRFFERGPFSLGISVQHGGDQYVVVNGLASDDVARLDLYLGSGERVAVPLEDNAYLIEVARTKFPIRLVAYDEAERVIGIETYGHDPLADPGPRPVECKQRVVKRVVGPNGTKGVLRVGPSTAGTRCHRESFE